MPEITTEAPKARPAFVVFPLRFTDHPREMIAFLTTLGMARSVTAGDDSFGDLRAGGGGAVMVHRARDSSSGASCGTTDLCLAITDADVALEQLEDLGLEATIWDESYGKQGMLDGPRPDLEAISLNEDQTDLYGYAGHDVSGADPRLQVCAVLASNDFSRDAEYFARLGFESVGRASEWWQELHGPAGAGIVGLHKPGPESVRTRRQSEETSYFKPGLQVRLGFETTEGLDHLAARLQQSGYDARVAEDAVRAVHVTDSDGLTIEIHSLR
jgi:hypothetical protein